MRLYLARPKFRPKPSRLGRKRVGSNYLPSQLILSNYPSIRTRAPEFDSQIMQGIIHEARYSIELRYWAAIASGHWLIARLATTQTEVQFIKSFQVLLNWSENKTLLSLTSLFFFIFIKTVLKVSNSNISPTRKFKLQFTNNNDNRHFNIKFSIYNLPWLLPVSI